MFSTGIHPVLRANAAMPRSRAAWAVSTIAFLVCSNTLWGQGYQTENNIAYYPHKFSQENAYLKERCVLDLYYPERTTGFPTVIWFHGGGLSSGEKHIPQELKERGVAVAAVNYRLYPKAKAEDCIQDATAATAWILENIQHYGGDSSLVFLSGHSAGAYLALMVGLDKKQLMKWSVDANRIAGIIPFSGHTITHFAVRRERGIPDYQIVVDELAPLYHVRKDAPPLLLITGDRELELLGRYEENAYLMRMMKVAGHQETKLLELDGYDHGMAEPAFPLLLKEIERIRKKHK